MVACEGRRNVCVAPFARRDLAGLARKRGAFIATRAIATSVGIGGSKNTRAAGWVAPSRAPSNGRRRGARGTIRKGTAALCTYQSLAASALAEVALLPAAAEAKEVGAIVSRRGWRRREKSKWPGRSPCAGSVAGFWTVEVAVETVSRGGPGQVRPRWRANVRQRLEGNEWMQRKYFYTCRRGTVERSKGGCRNGDERGAWLPFAPKEVRTLNRAVT